MRTVAPELWYTKLKETGTARRILGAQSITALEKRVRASFMNTLKEFWMNSSIESVKYMRQRYMPRKIRYCYIVFILALTLFGVLTVYRSWEAFRSVPLLIVTQVSPQHHVRYVDFPAVAFCTNNAISKTALEKYASYLYSQDVNGTYTLEDIERNLLAFGALVTWSSPPVDVSFMEYLERVAQETNVTNIIMKLTPQCTSFLIRCGWRTHRVPCERLFALRPTPYGYCCIFNSRYQDQDLYNPARRLHFVGQDFGLSVVIRKDDSDMTFIRGPKQAVEVLLFDGTEYPLIKGGSTKLFLTQHNSSAFLQLSAKVQHTAPNLHYYGENWLGCRIRHPRSRIIDHRSQTWCLGNCRRHTVQALCGCVPHLLFPQPGENVCSLSHLACLNKHKEKLSNVYPGDFVDSSLQEEFSDAMFCEHCLPDCARLIYSATISHADHQYTKRLFLNFFSHGLSLVNTTVLRIYYASEEQQLYIVETNRRWYEVVMHLASQWMFVVAVTVVGAMELVYHATIRWGYHFINYRRSDDTPKKYLTLSVEQYA